MTYSIKPVDERYGLYEGEELVILSPRKDLLMKIKGDFIRSDKAEKKRRMKR